MERNKSIVIIMIMYFVFIISLVGANLIAKIQEDKIIDKFVENCEVVNINTTDNTIFLEYENDNFIIMYEESGEK